MNEKKIILVTGGSRGIGKSVALKFVKNNYDVFITYVSDLDSAESTIDKLKKYGNNGASIKADFGSTNGVLKMYQDLKTKVSKLDVIVNNAGWTKYVVNEDFDSLSTEEFEKIIKINLESVYLSIKYGVKILDKNQSNIVNISSIAGYNATGSNLAYCAAKAGVISLTKSFAKILGPNIRVNGVAPGLTNTDMTASGPNEYYKQQKNITPLNRIAEPEDIADVTYSIVNDMKFVNGKTIVVDGGRLN